MSDVQIAWDYTGPNHNISFDDISLDGQHIDEMPSHLTPSQNMIDKFRKNCEKMSLLKKRSKYLLRSCNKAE